MDLYKDFRVKLGKLVVGGLESEGFKSSSQSVYN